jgi:hypothetical protein
MLKVCDEAVIGDLEDRRLLVLVDGNNHLGGACRKLSARLEWPHTNNGNAIYRRRGQYRVLLCRPFLKLGAEGSARFKSDLPLRCELRNGSDLDVFSRALGIWMSFYRHPEFDFCQKLNPDWSKRLELEPWAWQGRIYA